MKCDELKVRTVYVDWKGGNICYYDPNEVDAAIEELKQKLAEEREFGLNRAKSADHEIGKICAELCELRTENRKLKRALWLARASEARKEVDYWTCQDESSYAIVDFNVRHETIVSYKAPYHRPYKWILIWENVEHKCRNKAEEYK